MNNSSGSSAPHEATISLRDFFYIVFRHKKKIAGFFFVMLLLSAVLTLLMPKVYESNAQVLLRLGRENVTLDPTATIATSPINVNNDSRETEINSEIEILKSREIAERIIDAVGTERILNRPLRTDRGLVAADSIRLHDRAVRQIVKSLIVEFPKRTDIINISFRSRSPAIAHDVLDNLIRFYQDKHMSIFRPATSYAFIEQERDAVAQELKNTEDSMRILKDSAGIVSVADQQAGLSSRLTTLEAQYQQVQADQSASQARIGKLTRIRDTIPKIMADAKLYGVPFSSNEALRAKINELRVEQADLLTKFSGNSRRAKDLDRQINQVSSILDTQDVNSNASASVRQVISDLLAEESNLAASSARARNIKAAIDKTRREIIAFNDHAASLARLQRQFESAMETYRKYNENLEQARIDSGLTKKKISNISIIQAATFPDRSIVTSRKIINLLLGALFGLIGGLAIAFFFELFDHTIRRIEDVENHLGIQPLGVVPLLDKDRVAWRIPRSCAPTFDRVHEALRLARKDHEPCRVVAVLSSEDGEGITTIAPYLAVAHAQANGRSRVLLADLDIERPTLHRIFSIPHSPGITDFFRTDGAGTIVPAHMNAIAGLDVVASGHEIEGGIKPGNSKQFAKAIEEWKGSYDHIIFKMPPLSRSTLIMELADYVEEIILVIESERVRREVIMQSLNLLSRSGINIFGVILNKYRYHVPQWLYKRL